MEATHLDFQVTLTRAVRSFAYPMPPNFGTQNALAYHRDLVSVANGLQLQPLNNNLLACGECRTSAQGTPHVLRRSLQPPSTARIPCLSPEPRNCCRRLQVSKGTPKNYAIYFLVQSSCRMFGNIAQKKPPLPAPLEHMGLIPCPAVFHKLLSGNDNICFAESGPSFLTNLANSPPQNFPGLGRRQILTNFTLDQASGERGSVEEHVPLSAQPAAGYPASLPQ